MLIEQRAKLRNGILTEVVQRFVKTKTFMTNVKDEFEKPVQVLPPKKLWRLLITQIRINS